MFGSPQEFTIGQLLLAVPLGLALGLQGAMVVEIFPLRTRVTSMSFAYSITLALAGGTATEDSALRFNINSPKQLGDVLFNKMQLPKPLKYGKGKVISTAQDVLDELAEHHPVPRLVLDYRQLAKG